MDHGSQTSTSVRLFHDFIFFFRFEEKGHKWSKSEEKHAKNLLLTENWQKMRVYSDFLAFLDQNGEKF